MYKTTWLFDSKVIWHWYYSNSSIFVFFSCLSQDDCWMTLASLQQLLRYIQRFLNGQLLLYLCLTMQNQKKKEINISTMKIWQTPNKWLYLTYNKSVIFKPKLAKLYSDTQTAIYQWKLHNYKTHLDYFCL